MMYLLFDMNTLAKGLVIDLVGESNRSPASSPPMAASVMARVSQNSGPPSPCMAAMMTSSGSRVATVRRLNMSCTVAAEKARWRSMRLFTWPMETMVLVTEVPMLAPMMTGMAAFTVMVSAPTRPTTIDVLVDDDWTMTVARIPVMRPARGFSTAVNILPAPLPPRHLKASPSICRPTRKKYRLMQNATKTPATISHPLGPEASLAGCFSFVASGAPSCGPFASSSVIADAASLTRNEPAWSA
mmetsp:Transcript_29292/g.66409  ORF Transcript_29292/g.66409 Transcript_29292/m.66409 type:complete len:243 (-) Transcript_29292:14-742(-)